MSDTQTTETPQETVYPEGTKLTEIVSFDRRQKVAFRCTKHPESSWRSKDPFSSSWFFRSGEDGTPCPCNLRHFEVAAEYRVPANANR